MGGPHIGSIGDLGSTIRAARVYKGWTQATLAETAGVSRQWVSEVERGLRDGAELTIVLRVLRALGLRLTISDTSRPAPGPTDTRRDDDRVEARLKELGVL